MNQEPISAPPSSGMTLGDIYYVLFRHKWKIIIVSLIGLLVALALPKVLPRPYQSEAKILIRYLEETKAPLSGGDSRVQTLDQNREDIINSEIEILTSFDLVEQVAKIVGPEKILGTTAGTNDLYKAALAIHKALLVPVPRTGSAIQITYKHRDPAVVQQVLKVLLQAYFDKHREVHQQGFDSFLTVETDRLQSQLAEIEKDLHAAKTNAGIISLEETKRAFNVELARIRSDVFATEADLAQRKAAVQEISKLTNIQVETNAATATPTAVVPSEKVAEYRRVSSLLDSLVRLEHELSLQFTLDNPRLKNTQQRISESEKTKQQLEKEYPGLLAVVTSAPQPAGPNADLRVNLQTEMTAVAALTSKIGALTNQLAQVRQEADSVDAVEGSITELQRQRDMVEQQYKFYKSKLEEARINVALNASQISNIRSIQEPSPPFRDNLKLIKIMAITCVGAFALALAWAFATELYLDRSIRRPSQVGSQLHSPLFLSIPPLKLNGKSHGLRAAQSVSLLNPAQPQGEQNNKSLISKSTESREAIQPTLIPENSGSWEIGQAFRPLCETLRDRLITFFEVNNMTHKPKLVALTSCGRGAGVTTTAMGLAASLSETGEGNVLLVDMNLQNGEAHHFYKGRLELGLDDALTSDKRQGALLQENLYVVTEATNGSKQLPQLPQRFKHLVPKLRASDYDYIIFDMPPINQISATSRLAKFMDMVFLVVESEKTDRDVVKRATELLAESNVNTGIILNKAKAYVPKRLQQEV